MRVREPRSVFGMLARSVVRGVVMAFLILGGIVAVDTFGPPACRHRMPRFVVAPIHEGPPAIEGATIRARLLPCETLFLNDRLVTSRPYRLAWFDRLTAPFRDAQGRAAVEFDVRPAFDAPQAALLKLLEELLTSYQVERVRLAPPATSARRLVPSWIALELAPEEGGTSRDEGTLHFGVSADPKDFHRVAIRTPSGTTLEIDTTDDSRESWRDGAEPEGFGPLLRELRTAIGAAPEGRPPARIVCVIDRSTPYSAIHRILEACARTNEELEPSRRAVLSLSSPKSRHVEVVVSKSAP